MTAELLISDSSDETRVAYLNDGVLFEFQIERQACRGFVGNIYKGRVCRVLPGMQAAFIDIGLEKAGYLHVADINQSYFLIKREHADALAERNISNLIRVGQDIVVQVIKDPIGTKGARLTTEVSLPSRYLVFTPANSSIGISQRIHSPAERARLDSIVNEYCDEEGGFIIRTAAEGIENHELHQDAAFLRRLWSKIKERKKRPQPRICLYSEPVLAQRVLRDFVVAPLDIIYIDSAKRYQELVLFTQEYVPELTDKLHHYQLSESLFDNHSIETEIQQALSSNVPLKSGGYLVIEQTEAMTTIDINTGAFVGKRYLEETVLNLNIEATAVIARQLRLRNLGGIIIIDFIDMRSDTNRRKVLTALEQALSQDRVKTNVSGFSSLGLVEMTRKRTRESLENVLCGPCPVCEGRGTIKTIETICYDIMRELVRVNLSYEAEGFIIYVATSVYQALLQRYKHVLVEAERLTDKTVKLKPDPAYNQDQFDVVMV